MRRTLLKPLMISPVWFLTGLIALVLSPQVQGEQLSSQDPTGPLNIRPGVKESAEVLQKAEAVYRKGAKEVEAYQEYADAKTFNKINAIKVGQTYADLMQLQIYGEQLRSLGEPAGFDYIERFDTLENKIHGIVKAYRDDPKLDAKFSDDALMNAAGKEQGALAKLSSYPLPGKIAEMRLEFHEIMQRVNKIGIWYTKRRAYDQAYQQFSQYDRKDAMWFTLMRTNAKTVFEPLRDEIQPDLKSLIERFQKAADEVSQSGMATWESEQVPAHQWLEKFSAQWQDAYLAAVKTTGYDLALAVADSEAGADSWQLQCDATVADFYPALTAFLTADIGYLQNQKASDQDVRARYGSYLKTLARIVALTGPTDDAQRPSTDQLATSLDKQLMQLAATSSSLKSEVESYDLATRDLLRWRARAALQTAQRLGQTHQAITPSTSLVAALSDDSDAPTLLQEAEEKFGKKKIKASRWGIAETPVLAQSQLVESVYCRLADTPAWQQQLKQQVEQLRSDLLVAAGQPPMTLTAMVALTTAEQGGYEQVGGDVQNIVCEAATPEMIQVDANDWGAFRLNRFRIVPNSVTKEKACRWLWFRCELNPNWIAHRYFCIETENVAATGGE